MRRICVTAWIILTAGCSGDGKTVVDRGVADQQAIDQSLVESGADRAAAREAQVDRTRTPDLKPDAGPPSAWKETSFSATLNAIWGVDGKTMFAVGKGGLIVRYDGASWKVMLNPEKDDLYAVYGTAADAVFAGGDVGLLAYDGKQWTKLASTYDKPILRGIWSNDSNIFAVGPGGVMRYRSKSSTSTYWSTVYFSSTGKDFAAIWGAGTDLYVVGAAGLIMHCATASCANSSSWTTMTSNTTSNLQGVWGTAKDDVFAVGLDGTILHYDGTSWSAMASNTSTYFYGVSGSGGKDVYAVGKPLFKSDEAILHYDGTSWSTLPPPKAGVSYLDVWASSATDVWAVGQTGSILHYDGTKP